MFPLTVAQFSNELPVTFRLVRLAFPVECISPAFIAPVKVEVPVTDNCHNVALSEDNAVTVQFVAVKFVIVASVDVNVAIFPVDADNVPLTVTLPGNVVSVVTVKLSVVNESAVAAHKSDVVAVRVVIVPASAVNASAFSVSALTTAHSNSLALIFPENVTSHSTSVIDTCPKSKCIFSIRVSRASSSRYTL